MNKRSLLATPYIVWIIGFTVLPILMIVFYALGDGNGGFTLSNILAIFEPVHLKSLLLALWLALLCTVVCLLLAYPLAVILRKLNIGKKGLMAIIVILPMWVNFVLRIMAWQLLLSRNGIINAILGVLGLPGQDLANSNVAIVIGMVYDYLPFMILPVYNAVMELNEDVIEAARDLGAPLSAVLTKIIDIAVLAFLNLFRFERFDYFANFPYDATRRGEIRGFSFSAFSKIALLKVFVASNISPL